MPSPACPPSTILSLTALIAVAGLAACATDDPGPTPATPSPVAATANAFDGTYQGTRTPDDPQYCGFANTAAYDVAGRAIRLHTDRPDRMIAGAIKPDGRFAMLSDDGTRSIRGTITGDHLTGTEISPARHQRHGLPVPPGTVCHVEIDASRVPPPTPGT